jgi:hypothetical protein
MIGKPCPPLSSYTKEEQARACDELRAMCPALPAVADCDQVRTHCPTLQIPVMIDDYGLMRDQCR